MAGIFIAYPWASAWPPSFSAGSTASFSRSAPGNRQTFERRFGSPEERWEARLGEQRFAGLVLDYDGTVCWTKLRQQLPGEPVREALVTLLADGIVIGFASGRGK